MPRIAVIGLGARAASFLADLRRVDPSVVVAAVVDTAPEEVVRANAARFFDGLAPATEFFSTVGELVEHGPSFDGAVVGAHCAFHTEIALALAPLGLPMLLEKPVAIDDQQLTDLAVGYEGRYDEVLVSFPLRVTPLFTAALDIVRSGRLGRVNHVQAWNYVPYGGAYYTTWYRDYSLGGGLWLQKATHDFDVLNHLLGSTATSVAATMTRPVYGGDKPVDLVCSQCPEADVCPESPGNIMLRGDGGGIPPADHLCAFTPAAADQDAGCAVLTYPDGVIADYSQNFVSRRSAGRRGARVTGYLATLEFDWYTESITVIDHHRDRVDEIAVHAPTGHIGGDRQLVLRYLRLLRGERAAECNLADGLMSAAVCLEARRSCHSRRFEDVPSLDAIRARASARI
jgi:predicted dehydrogenase